MRTWVLLAVAAVLLVASAAAVVAPPPAPPSLVDRDRGERLNDLRPPSGLCDSCARPERCHPEGFRNCGACRRGLAVGYPLCDACAWARNECSSCQGPLRATASGDVLGHPVPLPESATGRP